jgi:hypothetical protein
VGKRNSGDSPRSDVAQGTKRIALHLFYTRKISKKFLVLPDVSATTIEIVVSQMLKQGKIKKIGTYKDAKYIKN